jgi:hypothetical protein
MLELLKPGAGTLCDRISRRRILEVGGLSAVGLSLAGLLRAEAAPASAHPSLVGTAGARPGTAKSCIIVFLNGGPSHLDMWDMKPDAPAEVRGEFKPISTPVAGIQMSEHLPRLAKLSSDYSLLRSVSHRVSNAHAAAVYLALTGDDRGDTTVAIGFNQKDFPAIGSVVGRVYPARQAMVPYVSLPYRTKEGAGGPPQPGFYGGWMGQQYDPLFIEKDPNAPNFGIPELTLPAGFAPARVEARRGLLHAVNGKLDRLHRDGNFTALDAFQHRALELVSSPNTRRAFDLSLEPIPVRESYGRNIYGQSILLARRLVEAGCRVVTMSWAPDANATWDTHGNNFRSLKDTLLPQLDACLSSLLRDLRERGLLEETLVVCMGEFGRSPKINAAAGRDHYPGCYGLLMAGGGVQGGRVIGQSDELGANPAETPLSPQDLIATIYGLLGISAELEFPDPFDRPLKILNGQGRFIHELV